MINKPNQALLTALDNRLPKSARTRSGIEYIPSDPAWIFRDGKDPVHINFKLLPVVAEPLIHGLKVTLIWYLSHRAPATSSSNFNAFVRLIRRLTKERSKTIDQIKPEDILTLKVLSDQSEYDLAYLRGFLKRWAHLGLPGVGKDVLSLLSQLTLKRNPVGVAVKTMDPKVGPLTDIEFEAIQSVLNNAYTRGEIEAEVLFLTFLYMATGARPAQFASMKICDLITPSNNSDYVLMIPRAKQLDQISRDEFKHRVLAHQIGEALHHYIQSIYTEFKDKLTDPWQAPMFPQKNQPEKANAPGFEFHRTPKGLTRILSYAFQQLCVPSERLTTPMVITPIRFRRTLATRAAEEGLPLIVIAEMMDHTTTKNVQIYEGLTSKTKTRLNRAMAIHMAPLAQAFSGRIIRSESDATHPQASSRIIDLRIDENGAGMGSCGLHADCGFAKPVACYTCNCFEPWLDGPHEKVLDYLIERRENMIKSTSSRIASINDRSILGCAQVMLRCREIKKGTL